MLFLYYFCAINLAKPNTNNLVIGMLAVHLTPVQLFPYTLSDKSINHTGTRHLGATIPSLEMLTILLVSLENRLTRTSQIHLLLSLINRYDAFLNYFVHSSEFAGKQHFYLRSILQVIMETTTMAEISLLSSPQRPACRIMA